MNDLITEVFRKYPLLIPNYNYTEWNGYISCAKEHDVLVSVLSPKFPSPEGTIVKVPSVLEAISPHRNDIQNIVTSAKSFLELLDKLKTFFASMLVDEPSPANESSQISHSSNLFESARNILEELTDKVGLNVVFSLSGDLTKLVLFENDEYRREHRIALKIPLKYPKAPPEILSVDLPEAVLPQFSELSSISDFYRQFSSNIQSLQDFWHTCDFLRSNAHVLEPRDPMYKDTTWRIAIAKDVFASLVLNPLDVRTCPVIRIVGSRRDSLEFEANLENNLKELIWDEDKDILDNLGRMLGVSYFPQPVEEEEEKVISSQLFQAQECCICFTSRSEDNSAPHKYCNNEKCNSYFHYGCLLEWFQALPTSEHCDTDFISGDCLNCGCKIVCPAQQR